jgi:hypothetical protein
MTQATTLANEQDQSTAYSDIEAAARQALKTPGCFGKGLMCNRCGMKTAEDCEANCLSS